MKTNRIITMGKKPAASHNFIANFRSMPTAMKVFVGIVPLALGIGVVGAPGLSTFAFGMGGKIPADTPPTEKEMEFAKEAKFYNPQTAIMAFHTNTFRQRNGAPPIALNESLNKAAWWTNEYYVNRIITTHDQVNTTLGHTTEVPGRKTGWDRANAFGYPWGPDGNNTTEIWTEAFNPTINEALDNWGKSQGHLDHLIKHKYTEFGVSGLRDQRGYNAYNMTLGTRNYFYLPLIVNKGYNDMVPGQGNTIDFGWGERWGSKGLMARWKVHLYRNGSIVTEGEWNNWQVVPEARNVELPRPSTKGRLFNARNDRAIFFQTPEGAKPGDLVVIFGQAADGSQVSPVSTAALRVAKNENALTHNLGDTRDVDGDGRKDSVSLPIVYKLGQGEAMGTPITYSLSDPKKIQRVN